MQGGALMVRKLWLNEFSDFDRPFILGCAENMVTTGDDVISVKNWNFANICVNVFD